MQPAGAPPLLHPEDPGPLAERPAAQGARPQEHSEGTGPGAAAAAAQPLRERESTFSLLYSFCSIVIEKEKKKTPKTSVS